MLFPAGGPLDLPSQPSIDVRTLFPKGTDSMPSSRVGGPGSWKILKDAQRLT